MRLKRICCGLLGLLLVLALAGCSKPGETPVQTQPDPQDMAVYYLTSEKNELCVRYRRVEDEARQDSTMLAGTLLQELCTPPDADCVSAIPSGTSALGLTISGPKLTLEFDDGYQNITNIEDILCRGAVVQTLTQVPGVAYVSFVSGDKTLGSVMSANQYISQLSGNAETDREARLTLYFANEAGDALVKTTRDLTYSSSISNERLVIRQLIAGPGEADKGCYPTLPSTLNLLGVFVKDKVCYINFSSSFMTDALGLMELIPIYSLVNSLTELDSVERVQITIEGSSAMRFKESVSLEKPFARDTSLVQE